VKWGSGLLSSSWNFLDFNELPSVAFEDCRRASTKTRSISIIKLNWLMLFGKIVIVYFESQNIQMHSVGKMHGF
jgi:hypothetical protein